MMRGLLAAALAAVLAGPALADGPLDVFKPFCGKTWRGEFTGSDGAAMVDVSRWEFILGGKAVRTVHSLNDGVYGGESLMYLDPERQALAFVYITTAGFRTDGTITVDGGTFTALETVHGDSDGITEVSSTFRLREDGALEVSSRYLKHGEWTPGHAVVYVEAPGAEVRFE